MTARGEGAEPLVAEREPDAESLAPEPDLGELRRVALERLLDVSAELTTLGKMAARYATLGQLGEAVAEQACALAGLHVPSPDAVARDRLVFVVELEAQTSKLWDCHARIPKEKIVVHYLDGPSRQAAIANGLILLARALLDQLPTGGLITPEVGLSCDLEEAMAEYDQALEPTADELARQRAERSPAAGAAEPEPSYHGSGGVD